jgi:phenylacetic acid degradation operon negative regulatory protein
MGMQAKNVIWKLRGWRHADKHVDTHWDGNLLGLFIKTKLSSSELRATRLAGFRIYDDNLMVRPGNLSGGLAAIKGRIPDEFVKGQYWSARLSELTNDQEQRFRALYDVDQIECEYNNLLNADIPTEKTSDLKSLHDMVTKIYRVGRAAVVSIISDPLLPKEMVDVALCARAIKRAKRYYDQSSKYWAMLVDDELQAE